MINALRLEAETRATSSEEEIKAAIKKQAQLEAELAKIKAERL